MNVTERELDWWCSILLLNHTINHYITLSYEGPIVETVIEIKTSNTLGISWVLQMHLKIMDCKIKNNSGRYFESSNIRNESLKFSTEDSKWLTILPRHRGSKKHKKQWKKDKRKI